MKDEGISVYIYNLFYSTGDTYILYTTVHTYNIIHIFKYFNIINLMINTIKIKLFTLYLYYKFNFISLKIESSVVELNY